MFESIISKKGAIIVLHLIFSYNFMYTNAQIYTAKFVHTCTYTHIHEYTHTHTHTNRHTHAYAHTHTHTHIYIYVCVCVSR